MKTANISVYGNNTVYGYVLTYLDTGVYFVQSRVQMLLSAHVLDSLSMRKKVSIFNGRRSNQADVRNTKQHIVNVYKWYEKNALSKKG